MGHSKYLRWSLSLLACASAMAGTLALWIAVRSYRTEAAVFYPVRHEVLADAAGTLRAVLSEVSFRSKRGDTLRGWYVPSQNRAAIVLCHGSGGDRTSLSNEAAALHARGFGVLLFDWPGHGESEGEVRWGTGERAAFEAALDFLAQRPEVDPSRLGAYGFSMGGFVAALASASDQRVRALALAGTPGDAVAQTRWEYRRWGPLSQQPALWAIEGGGLPLDGTMPIHAIGRVAPRPLLIIGGSDDPTVPEHLTRQLFEAAREPKRLLIVQGAGHGGYERTAPAFFDTLANFFAHALVSVGEAAHTER